MKNYNLIDIILSSKVSLLLKILEETVIKNKKMAQFIKIYPDKPSSQVVKVLKMVV
jgi:hypothetical protein